MLNHKPVWALGGASLCAPEDTFPAYWGALGAGAYGLAIGVQLTSDGEAVCCRRENLQATCGDPRIVGEMTRKQLRTLDAGSQFRSTELDEENQPGGHGDDTPWQGSKSRPPLYHPELGEILLQFARRTNLMVWLIPPRKANAQSRKQLVDAVLAQLHRFGLVRCAILAGDVKTLEYVRKASAHTPVAMTIARTLVNPIDLMAKAVSMDARYVLIDAERLVINGLMPPGIGAALGESVSLLASTSEPFTPKPAVFRALANEPWFAGFVCGGVHEIQAMQCPPNLIVQDDFAGTGVNRDYWTMGYSKVNQDTQIRQKDGLIIQIREGGEYSGAAALTSFPIRGDFDAQVSFEVGNPHQGTTFELAAIQVDPGYHHMDNKKLDRRSVNLTFDVHGAPPYASSERDENDGFRIGWNNGPAVAEFVKHNAQSSNIYNKYSRDVGDGAKSNPKGRLRLVRRGEMFNAYYTDKHNRNWVLSGTALVPTLCQDVFLRLGAKHWPKRGETPPHNRIRFSEFRLYQ